MECTEVYARAGTCRESTYGTQKLSRLWILKSGSAWLQCQYPDLKSKCVSISQEPADQCSAIAGSTAMFTWVGAQFNTS